MNEQSDEQAGKRRMAAVLAADVAGYSRLMGDNEEATIAALGRSRAVFREHVSDHAARVVDTAGDSVLSVFESVIEAVRCALAVQETLAARNADVPEDRRMQFRIGVHFGDIVEQEDGTVYGDGVNIAARLESLAEPGGLTVSGTVHEHIEGKLGIGLADLGEQEVKNIARPVRAWRVAAGGEPTPARAKKPNRVALAAAAALLVVMAGGAAWLLIQPNEATDTSPDLALALPTGPKIAVIPLANLSGDPAEEYFSDGLTEDIINRLTNFPNLLVFARNSTSKYKGQDVDASTVGEELGAEYVVEGSVRRSDGHLRVTVQVLDAIDGTNLWAKNYDRDLTAANVFEVQDAVTEGIVNAIGDYSGLIARAELEKALRKPPNSLTTVECGFLLTPFYDGPTPEKHLAMRSCYERAVESDPEFAPAHAWLAWAYLDEYRFGFNTQPNSLDRALASALRAVEIDRNLVEAHQIEALIHFHRGELDAFKISAERAIALNPHNATVLADMGLHLTYVGDPDRATAMVEKAIMMNPTHPPWYHYSLTHHYLTKKNYETALNHAPRLTWGLSWDYMFRTVIYARSGRMDEARTEAGKLLENYPSYGEDARGEFDMYHFSEEVIGAYFETLREVGIDIPDEQPPTN